MRCVAVFCKRPRAGQVKTRLAAAIGDTTAAGLYAAFLRDTIATCCTLSEVDAAISFTPRDARGYFAGLAPDALLLPQPDADFGTRVATLFRELHGRGYREMIVIGGDTPQLGATRLRRAFDALGESDVVLGPAEDGGYYLLGLRRPRDELFASIDWSSPEVAEQTRERAADARLRLTELETELDVDDLGSLSTLHERAQADARTCPHTLAFLRDPGNAPLRSALERG